MGHNGFEDGRDCEYPLPVLPIRSGGVSKNASTPEAKSVATGLRKRYYLENLRCVSTKISLMTLRRALTRYCRVGHLRLCSVSFYAAWQEPTTTVKVCDLGNFRSVLSRRVYHGGASMISVSHLNFVAGLLRAGKIRFWDPATCHVAGK